MKKLKYILMMVFGILLFTACNSSDDDDDDDDTSAYDQSDPDAQYYNWIAKNYEYFLGIYKQAKTNEDGNWYIVKGYSKKGTSINDSVMIHVLSQNNVPGHKEVIDGKPNTDVGVTALFNEYAQITYRGNLKPFDQGSIWSFYNSTNGPDKLTVGVCFDTKFYEEEMDTTTALFTMLSPSSCVTGFGTILTYMHPGDRWRVFIPYNLGYGTTDTSSVPAGSTLIFDIYCKGIYEDDND